MTVLCEIESGPLECLYLTGENQLETRVFAPFELEEISRAKGTSLVLRGIDIGRSEGLPEAIHTLKSEYPVASIIALWPDGFGARVILEDSRTADAEFDLARPPIYTTLQVHRIGTVTDLETGETYDNGNILAAALIVAVEGNEPASWPLNLFSLGG